MKETIVFPQPMRATLDYSTVLVLAIELELGRVVRALVQTAGSPPSVSWWYVGMGAARLEFVA